MSKTIAFNKEAKQKLRKGVEQLAEAVSTTMGPYGRNVLIEDPNGNVTSTKDGVSVAKIVELEDPMENIAASVIKQAAIKTVEQAGDGTTTSTVLAQAITTEALIATEDLKVNATQLKRGIESAVKEVVEGLNTLSQDIIDDEQIKQVAKLSANGDENIATLVAEAFKSVGRDGLISVDESRTGETSLETVEGLQFDRGYKSPYFVTDNNTMQSVLKDPYILICDSKLTAMNPMLDILSKLASDRKSLVVIAEDVEGEFLQTLMINKARGVLQTVAVKAPEFGDRRLLVLEDIATLTGGKVISPAKGDRFDRFDEKWFGRAKSVTVGRDTTTIIDGRGDKDLIRERVETLQNQLDNATSPYEIEKLQERLAKMVGGVAVISIGGANEMEMKERKDRLDDALQATRAAVEEGILPGCGTSLLKARQNITFKEGTKDFLKGKQIVFDACKVPFDTIIKNAGKSEEMYFDLLSKKTKQNLVPDLSQEKYVVGNSLELGVIDPTKVVRLALQNAAGASTTLLLTECVIHDKPSDKPKEINPMEMMGMGGM